MNDTFLMLGIESSCDETAAALVKSDGTILASEIASQMEVHAAHGGVVPEIAARAHLDAIDSVIGGAMEKAGVTMGDLDGVAATGGPGLIGGGVVGTGGAQGIAPARGNPHYAGNHLGRQAPSPRPVGKGGLSHLLLLGSGGHKQPLGRESPGGY